MSQWQRTGVAKVPAVVDWLMTALGARKGGDDGGMGGGGGEAAGPKLLVFAHHRRVMNRLAAALEGAAGYAPVPYVRIDGSTDAEDRCLAVRRFRHEPALRVALLSVTAAGVGLDFSAAALVVFAELPGEVAHVRQAEDRAHRQGQSHPVNVYFLCAKGTTDDRRWQQLNRSLARVAAVHDGAGEGGSGNEAVAAQAGLLVDGVLDAEEGGMTQAAAGARGWAPPPTSAAAQLGHQEWPGDGSEAPSRRDSPGGGTQTGESPLPPATAAAAMRAAAAAAAGGEVGAGVPHCCACERPAAGSAPESVAANPAETADSRAGAAEECSPRGTQVPAAAPPAPSPALQGPASASTPPQAPASAACPPAQPCGGVPVWFEVSANTQRVHLHGAADGSAPLHLSLPQEALLAHGSPALQQLLEAVRAAEQAQGEQQQTQQGGAEGQHGSQGGQQGAAAAAAAGSGCSPPVIPGVGVVALDPGLGVGRLAAMLAEAREFAAEWAELRSLFRSRLYNTVLRLPLQEAVEEVERAAAAAGRLGTSHARFVGGQGGRADLALPPGAAWHAVKVVFPSHGSEGTYQQPFSAEGGRLCMNCAKAVPLPSGSLPREAVLEGMAALFCGGDCEGWYARKSNGSACRRALFALERGVCVLCRLDCHALVKRLQAVEKGTRGWEAARRRIVAQHWPRLLARGYGAYLDLLIRRAVQGHAWQADHVVPVYKGGGLCDVDNLRTLCVACHADVTKAQARERKQAREAARAGSSLAAGAGKNAAPKRRNRIPRMICEDSGEEGPDARQLQQQPQPAKEGDSAAPPRPMRRQRKLKQLISDAEDGEVPLMQDAGGGEPPGAAAGQGAAGGKRPLSSSAPTSQVSDAAQPRKRGRAAAPGQSRVPAVKRRERASGRSYVDDEAL